MYCKQMYKALFAVVFFLCSFSTALFPELRACQVLSGSPWCMGAIVSRPKSLPGFVAVVITVVGIASMNKMLLSILTI